MAIYGVGAKAGASMMSAKISLITISLTSIGVSRKHWDGINLMRSLSRRYYPR